jgi:hypothetical protein
VGIEVEQRDAAAQLVRVRAAPIIIDHLTEDSSSNASDPGNWRSRQKNAKQGRRIVLLREFVSGQRNCLNTSRWNNSLVIHFKIRTQFAL